MTASSSPSSSLSDVQWLELFKAMFAAREIDRLEAEFTARGEAFFHVAGTGHEASAALAFHLREEDWLHCHYRDKALMLARGLTAEDFFLALFAKNESHSAGRQMSAHMSSRKHHILSLPGPVGNQALQAAGVAEEVKTHPSRPIVLCSMGEGTTQQGEVLEGIAEAVRNELPVLFLVENNRLAISTRTAGRTFFEHPSGPVDSFYGIPITRVSAADPVQVSHVCAETVARIRAARGPAIVVMEGERLSQHTNADDQSIYRSQQELEEAWSRGDPLPVMERWLREQGVASARDLQAAQARITAQVQAAAERAMQAQEPVAALSAMAPFPEKMLRPEYEYLGRPQQRETNMGEALRLVLEEHLRKDPRVTLYGEDIQDPKGDVFGLTRGLSTTFPGRVRNSPLSEATIVGTSVGRALAGGRPVAFLQFADFLPIAFNQIISEMGSMYWRTRGHWQCPLIVMLSCGGYRPGLGPFHAQSSEALAAHVPGVDVMMPSAADDAAGLLNAAFESGRPTLFFYPKSCLNRADARTSGDVVDQRVVPGKARMLRRGRDLSLVAWGNAVPRCLQAADRLEQGGVRAEVIDLRWLKPWDVAAVLQSVRRTRRLIVVHEDNRTCGLGAEIGATVMEAAGVAVQFKRVVRSETYVPFHFGNQLEVLPSVKRIVEAGAELCDLRVEWEREETQAEGDVWIEAIGTGPSDESVEIIEWHVATGDVVSSGDLLCCFEAEKAVGDLLSPASGEILEIAAGEGERIRVGAPLVQIRSDNSIRVKPPTREKIAPCSFTSARPVESASARPVSAPEGVPVYIEGVAARPASRRVSNAEVLEAIEGHRCEEIVQSTGIRSRRRVADGESAVDLAEDAVRRLLSKKGLQPADLDLILLSTGTPGIITPSLACRVLHRLNPDLEIPAYDFSAACSGFIYGLKQAYDHLQQSPRDRILLITVEVLSPLLKADDYGTAILFSDAASATLIGSQGGAHAYRVERPLLLAKGEPGKYLVVPASGADGGIEMNGRHVFSEGVRKMGQVLQALCHSLDLSAQDLDLIIPHQANQRIIEALTHRLHLAGEKVFSNIEKLGNSSSNTIPLALADLEEAAVSPDTIGLTAFGGGFTYAAAILRRGGSAPGEWGNEPPGGAVTEGDSPVPR